MNIVDGKIVLLFVRWKSKVELKHLDVDGARVDVGARLELGSVAAAADACALGQVRGEAHGEQRPPQLAVARSRVQRVAVVPR